MNFPIQPIDVGSTERQAKVDFVASPANPRDREKLGMLLVGHGTRDLRGLDEFFATARLISQRLPNVAVEPCFLELAEPSIADAVARLAARRLRQIVVSPLLLFAAGHAKRDIPEAVRAATVHFPEIHICQAEHLGVHHQVLQASAARFLEAVETLRDVNPQDCALLMVGRGSLDESATREMKKFTAERTKLTPVLNSATCFVAMAKPTFDEAISEIMTSLPKLVVVQPHLLFHGELLTTVQSLVEDAASRFSGPRFSDTKWLVPQHLGADPLIAAAVVELFLKASLPPMTNA